MNQFKFLPAKALMILFAFFMVACEDDESEEPKANPLVGGTWQWTINERTNCGDPTDEGEFALTDCNTEGCFFYEFRADGTYKITFTQGETSESGVGNYTLTDGHLTTCITIEGTEECDSGDITITGDRFEWFKPKVEESSCDVNHIYERI